MQSKRNPRKAAYAIRVVLLTCLLTALVRAQSPAIFDPPLSPRYAKYSIDVTLDDVNRQLDGTAVLLWTNPSKNVVDELQFHLYSNAFRNAKSTFMREMIHDQSDNRSGTPPQSVLFDEDNGWGGTNVTRMAVNDTDVTDKIAFFPVDDGNGDDQTVIRVPLPIPIVPGDTAKVDISFHTQIPQAQVRTGWWQDDFFLISHWFPSIGVYETPGMRFVPEKAPTGQWNCHQFHAATEYYSEFATFDVKITLPEKYIVGTTGLIVEEHANGNGTKTVVSHAEDVHEFAWVADAQFREAKETWKSANSGRTVDIRLLYQPAHESVAAKYMHATKETLSYVENWLGPNAYPYPNITVVDPRAESGAGGMEYPTLITGDANWFADKLMGDGLRLTEIVTIHEFMHQIWYGVVADNEFEEAWLDEGMASYSESRISSHLFGTDTSILDWWGATAGDSGMGRAQYSFSSRIHDGSIADWTFKHWDASIGRMMAYGKSNLMLATLEHRLGRDKFDEIMRTYYQRWRFRHPCRNDFIHVAKELTGHELDGFFEQVMDDTTSLDYAVVSITNTPIEDFDKGILGERLELPPDSKDEDAEEDSEVEAEEESSEDDKPHVCRVVFRRVGEMVMPVDTLIEFSDGEVLRDTWDGEDRIKVYKFKRDGKVVRAVVDPDFKIPLDTDYLNNSLRIDVNKFVTDKYTARGFFWMQSLLQFFSLLG